MKRARTVGAGILFVLAACGPEHREAGGPGSDIDAPGQGPVSPSTGAQGERASDGASDGTNGGTTEGPSSDAGTPSPPKVDVTAESLAVLGEIRTFVLVAPRTYDPATAYPLVLVFHGDGGTGAGMRAAYRLDDVTGGDAFVAYPDSKGGASWDLYTPSVSNADEAFALAIVESLGARFHVDPSRIFGSGYSSGAFFINQLACRRPGLFRAIAPNAGGAPNEPQDPNASYWKPYYTRCANQSAGAAAIVFHGTDDTTVLPSSGDFTAQYWAFVDGCDDSQETRLPTSPSPCVRHASCPPGMPVVYCPIPNIGHTTWSESAKVSWSFFLAL